MHTHWLHCTLWILTSLNMVMRFGLCLLGCSADRMPTAAAHAVIYLGPLPDHGGPRPPAPPRETKGAAAGSGGVGGGAAALRGLGPEGGVLKIQLNTREPHKN